MGKVVELYPQTGNTRQSQMCSHATTPDLKAQITAEILTSLIPLLDGPTGRRPHRWLSSREVCKKSNLSMSALRKMREARKIAYAYINGDYYYYPFELAPIGQPKKNGKRPFKKKNV